MDYDKVNNPFITLRKMSDDSDAEFTTKLNTSPPNVDNDPNMSNLKKSNHALYSDERTSKMRLDEETKTFQNYAITLLDIDNILYEYFLNVIDPQVLGSNGTIVKVPVRHASPERWAAIRMDGIYRDKKGQVQRPMIVFTRTSVAKDDSFVHFNKYLTVPFVKKFSQKNAYDRFSVLNQANEMYEVHNITFPDHVILNYDFTMSTEYVEQMNTLVETINFASDDYWGDPKRLKFRASVDSFSNTVEVPSDEDRNVTTTFSITVNAYLLPEVFDSKTTVQRGITTRKVIWGTEVTGTTEDVFGKGSASEALLVELGGNKKNITLNRTMNILHLDEVIDIYEIRMWNDLEFYEININGRDYKITTDVDEDDNDIFIWDFENEEVALRHGQTYLLEIRSSLKLEIKVSSNSSSKVSFTFIK